MLLLLPHRLSHAVDQQTGSGHPDQHVVTGFSGRSGLLIDAVRLHCSKLNTDGTLGSKSTTVPVGGTGGSAFPEKACAAGMAVGLYGRAGNDLDFLALECSTLS